MTEPSIMPSPSLDVLSTPIKEAYEASYLITQNLTDDDNEARTAQLAYDAQTILNLLAYVLDNPEQEDLSPNFGGLTIDALGGFIRQIAYRDEQLFDQRLRELIDNIQLPDQFSIIIGRDPEHYPGRFYFQIRCWRQDVITKEMGFGYGGKAYLSPHQTNSELVQTIFGLYKGYWEHEARESFEYDHRRVFGPHISTKALHSIARKVDVRSAKHIEDQQP